jgi:hypothetical protein
MRRLCSATAVAIAGLLMAVPAHAAKAPTGAEFTVFAGGGSHPDVVYNSVDDEYLVVWDANGTVEGRVVRPDHSGAGPVFAVSAPDRGGAPKAAYDPLRHEYLVVWAGPAGTGDEVLGQRLSATGFPVGTDDFQISASGGTVRSATVAYRAGHDEYGVAWEANGSPGPGEVFLRRISGDGTALAAPTQVSDPERGLGHSAREPAIAYGTSEDRYLLAWVQDAQLERIKTQVVGRLVEAGDGSAGPVIPISGSQLSGAGAGDRSEPALAYNPGNGYLVVWTAAYDYIGPWIVGDTVLPSGLVGGGEFSIRYPRLPGPFPTNGSREPTLAFDPPSGAFEVLWRGATTLGDNSNDEIFGVTRYDGTDPFQVSGADGLHYDSSEPSIAYDSNNEEHLVVWTSAGSPGVGFRILARRLAKIPPPGTIDRRDPRVRISLTRLPHILRRRSLVVRASCDEACTLGASAKTQLSRPGRTVRFRRASKSVRAETWVKLLLRAPRAALRTLRRAFRHRSRLAVHLTVTASDAAGNKGTLERTLVARR